ncbi:MAG: ATP-binding cassette domain-containing protein [Pseudomonadota bacterium]
MNAPVLTLADLGLTFGGAPLFTCASLEVGRRARIALAGRNGSGKSTLMKIAAGLVEPDRGERFLDPKARLVYLPQEPDFSGVATAGDYVVRAAGLVRAHEGERALSDIGIDPATALSQASGGEMRRIALAGAFAQDPDVFLLDEPTNHLDIEAIEWLEARLKVMRAALVLISHDRRFLETLTDETVWIDRGETKRLRKGFAAFEAWRDKLLEEEASDRQKLSRKIAAEEDWVRYGVTARRKRNVRRLGELQALRKELREQRAAPSAARMDASMSERSGKRVIVAKGVTKSFGARTIVDDFSIEILRGERVGLVAPNGAGKTTLLNLMTGALSSDTGDLTLGANLQLTSLDQHRAALKPETRVADVVTGGRGDWVTINGARRHIATYLQDFLFAPEQFRSPVEALSGGERGRLAIAAALARPSNLLALDEPTNDLDLETLDVLEDLVANYQGTVLLVSHDRSFLDRIVTSIIAPAGSGSPEGKWIRYVGGYDDMVRAREGAPMAKPSEKAKPRARKTDPSKSNAKKAEKLSYKDQYALDALPNEIKRLEKEIAALSDAMADPSLYERDPTQFEKTAAALEAAKQSLSEAEERWLELELKRDALK